MSPIVKSTALRGRPIGVRAALIYEEVNTTFGDWLMLRSISLAFLVLSVPSLVLAGPYAPRAGQAGSDAIAGTSSLFLEWASGYTDNTRGPLDIAHPANGLASYGSPTSALGAADNTGVVSLGDGGSITLTFDRAIANGSGADFAVFENGFGDAFLELAFVDVSSNGVDFFRFPSVSLTPTATQIGGFSALDATNLFNLAGKFRAGYGTPFDLSNLTGVSPLLNLNDVRYVRVTDVIGTINPLYASHDSLGNIVNDPYSTGFASGGFDLDAVGVLNVAAVPEPASLISIGIGLSLIVAFRSRCRRHPG
jgi:hypothetical protein